MRYNKNNTAGRQQINGITYRVYAIFQNPIYCASALVAGAFDLQNVDQSDQRICKSEFPNTIGPEC